MSTPLISLPSTREIELETLLRERDSRIEILTVRLVFLSLRLLRQDETGILLTLTSTTTRMKRRTERYSIPTRAPPNHHSVHLYPTFDSFSSCLLSCTSRTFIFIFLLHSNGIIIQISLGLINFSAQTESAIVTS